MAFSIAGLGGLAYNWIKNPLIIVSFLILILAGSFLYLKIRRRRRLKFPIHEITEYGVNTLKAGWLGINLHLRGLWWTGREIMRTDENEIIEGFSEEDFTEINGERGIIICRDAISKRLFPISRLIIDKESRKIMARVPPKEFIDTSVEIIKEAKDETSDRLTKILQFVAWALVLIISLLAIVFIVQMIKSSQQEASKLVLEAGKTCLESARQVCSDIANIATHGTTAP